MRFSNLVILLLLAQALTGLALLFHYRPTVAAAYFDIVDLREISRFGFARSLHRWTADAAVIVVWLHLLRTGIRAATTSPHLRRAWLRAIALMLLILAFATTGHLLPWDTDAYWGIAELAVTAADDHSQKTTPVAPAVLDDGTLLRFYVLHCVFLPLAAIGLVAVISRSGRRKRR